MATDMRPPKPIYRADRPAVACIAAVKAHRTFRHGAAWLGRFAAGRSLREVVTAIRDDPVVPVEWARWLLKNFGPEFDEECRACFLAKLGKYDRQAMWSFCAWRDFAWLTDAEDGALEAIWRGKLPTVEAELQAGLHPRAKAEAVRLP